MVFHGHFPYTFGGFRENTPDPDLEPDFSDRFQLEGYNKIVQEHNYQFYQDWTGPGYPRMLIIQIQHANPFYDDSYAVNSANLGPYGDAITYELIPHIEKEYRGIGEGWARFLYGVSTLEQMNHRELVLGTKSRSGDQWDIWEAVYSPVGSDGYPARIWDKKTGEIDHKVAEYWRDNYDLRYIVERDWKTLGPKLEGKINIYCGDMDNYYLNNAVYLMENFLESTQNPYYNGEVDYGDRAEHCWNGDQERGNGFSRLRYNQMYLPKILERMEKTAPAGADLGVWMY